MKIAVVTASLETRSNLLLEAMESVRTQTLKPAFHSIAVDYGRNGEAATRNRAAESVMYAVDWLAFLDDDDLFKPKHLELLSEKTSDADVVYSDYETVGRDRLLQPPSGEFRLSLLRSGNYIPVTAMIRAELFAKLDGFQERCRTWPDWELWLRAAEAGARFRWVPEKTWVYRFGTPDQITREYTQPCLEVSKS